jgi:hypothetical protein
MRFELRPLSLGEVLDGAFKIFRVNLRLFLTIALMFAVPDALITVGTRICSPSRWC